MKSWLGTGDFTDMNSEKEREQIAKFMWKSHVALLDLVDLIEDQPNLRNKLKTKILDVAHQVQEELIQEEE